MDLLNSLKETQTFKIVGMDPGTMRFGYAVLEIDARTLKVLAGRAETICAEKLHPSEWLEQSYGARYSRVFSIGHAVMERLREDQPLGVTCESPFYSKRRPNAYGALMEVLAEIKRAVLKFDSGLCLYFKDPPSVKRSVGAKVSKDKDFVKLAIKNNSSLSAIPFEYLDELDEHAIDAIAVAYSLLDDYQRNLFPRLGEIDGT